MCFWFTYESLPYLSLGMSETTKEGLEYVSSGGDGRYREKAII